MTEIDIYNDPIDTATNHTRYIIVDPEAPGLTHLDGMIELFQEEKPDTILLLTPEGTTVPVEVRSAPDGVWAVYLRGTEDALEIVRYSPDGKQVLEHFLYVDGFANDQVPLFR